MIISREITCLWKNQDFFSKSVIICSMILVVFAYLPTLQFDYVVQDQWRAFRYSTESQSPISRLKECSSTVSNFYAMTGRPFVWLTECMEHFFVSTISDFNFLRILTLLLVIFTVIYLSLTISIFIQGVSSAFIVGSIFVMSPAYSFMYFQSFTALMVLFSLIFSIASYKYINELSSWRVSEFGKLFKSAVFFLIACFIYPAYAFIVFPLILLQFSTDIKSRKFDREKNLIFAISFFTILSILYYLIIKLYLFAMGMGWFSEGVPDLGPYEVFLQLTPSILFDRIKEIVVYLYRIPPLNFYLVEGWSFIIVLAFSVNSGVILSSKFGFSKNFSFVLNVFINSLLVFFVIFLTLLISFSPWIFSNMGSLETRYVLPYYLFISFSLVWVIKNILDEIGRKFSCYSPVVVMLLILFPVSFIQNKNSFFEVVTTNAEIEFLRAKIDNLVENWGLSEEKFILVIRPNVSRLIGVDTLISNNKYGNENAVLASSQNPVSIPWMFNAILREHEKNYNLFDCAFDTMACVENATKEGGNIVIAYTNGLDPIESSVEPYLINLSELTSEPVHPVVNIIEPPGISVTSILRNLGPEGLFSSAQPGWHAQKNPIYPQVMTIDHKEIKFIGRVSFLPQDNYVERMPKYIKVETSVDGSNWVSSGVFPDLCVLGSEKSNWHEIELGAPVKAQYIRIKIYSNCGDPNYLTLRGLKISP